MELVAIILLTDFNVKLNNITHVKQDILRTQHEIYIIIIKNGKDLKRQEGNINSRWSKHINIKVGKSTACREINVHEVGFTG